MNLEELDEKTLEDWRDKLKFAVGKMDKSRHFPGQREKIHEVADNIDEVLEE
jgi:hypothetical protein